VGLLTASAAGKTYKEQRGEADITKPPAGGLAATIKRMLDTLFKDAKKGSNDCGKPDINNLLSYPVRLSSCTSCTGTAL
jgi:hypothetical protein